MKNKNYLTAIKIIFLMLMFCVSTVNSQTIFTIATPDGYGRNTTGGNIANTVTVTTAADFRTAAESSTSMVIIVSGTLNIESYGRVNVNSNKTIIGANTSSTILGCLALSGESNVIIQNLNLTNPNGVGTADGLEATSGCTDIFVHKCTFIDCKDGSFDIKHGSDNVTVSWCRFRYPTQTNHNFPNLIGHTDDNGAEDRGKLHVTMHHNWYDIGCNSRTPRVRYGTVHVYNNFYASPGNNYCIGTGYECHIRLENGSFENVNDAWNDMNGMANGGEIGWSGCKFVSTAIPTYAPNNFPVFTPPYTFTLDPVDDVKSLVTHTTCGAGNCGPCVMVTLVLTSGTASQLVSAGTAITDIVYTWGGTATDVTVTGLPAGLTATKNAGAKTVTIAGTPTATGTYDIATIQLSGAGATANGTITVVPLIAPTLVLTSGTASQSILLTSAITDIVFTWGGGATDVTVTGLPAGVNATKDAGAKTITLSGTPTTLGETIYTIETVGGLAPMVTQTDTITVTAPFVLDTPTGVSATSTSSTVTVNWTPVASATGYVINFCLLGTGSAIREQWDFIPAWSIDASDADANLILDGDRFNYAPATTNGAIQFASGTNIPDLDGLLFTQNGGTSLRLGFAKSLLYQNGTGIVCTIPCQVGDTVEVVGPAANSSATDRGYSVTGGTLIPSQCINVDASGIMYVAAGIGTWRYLATSTSLKTTTIGGMNIQTITVFDPSGSPTCTEHVVVGGTTSSHIISGLIPSTTYTYQIKATNAQPLESSPYTTEASIATTAFISTIYPVVSITAPVTDSCFTANSTIALTANATDADGIITSVQFYNGAALLGSGTAVGDDYTFNWTSVPEGTYLITALATDDSTATTISTAITIKVFSTVTITGLGAGIITCAAPSITLGSSQVAASYAWTKDAVSVGSTASLNAINAGEYGLTVTYANACSANASTVIVTKEICAANIIVQPNLNHDVKVGGQLNEVILSWTGGSFSSIQITGLPEGMIAAIDSINGTITISGTPKNSAMYTIQTINGNDTIYYSGTIRVKGHYVYQKIGTHKLMVSGDVVFRLEVYTANGKYISKIDGVNEIELDNIISGGYIVRITDIDKSISSHKFVWKR